MAESVDFDEAYRIAKEVVDSTINRAPSFVMINFIFSHELDQRNLDGDMREAVVQAARLVIKTRMQRASEQLLR